MALTIELRPELENWLTEEAARRGQAVPELTRALLETTITDAAKRSCERILPGECRNEGQPSCSPSRDSKGSRLHLSGRSR